MKENGYLRIICCLAVLALGRWCGHLTSQAAMAAENKITNVGRENPFAEIPKPIQTVEPSVIRSLEPIEQMPGLFVKTVVLKFLDAKSLAQAIANMSSPYGAITINEKNNSLIICDTEENLEKIVAEIKKIDRTPPQIMVEVVIVDVQLSDDEEIGVNWDILSTDNYDIGYRQNFTSRLASTIPSEDNVGNATAFNTVGLGGDFSVISGTIRNVVSMLQQKKDVEVLASPRVMVLSGKTASIKSVRELPFNEVVDTYGGGSMSSTEFKNVGVTLDVTATLTEEDMIFLNINAEQNVVVGESATEVPIVDTRNAQSEVLLKDGQVVVIGGLRRKEYTKQINQIPILGDIPLLGFLFKNTNTVVSNTELIVFLSPHIYKEGEPIPENAMKKYREIKEMPMPLLEKDEKTKISPEIDDGQVIEPPQ
jgi:type II secretory pathway component GspD/PulD (secretin)